MEIAGIAADGRQMCVSVVFEPPSAYFTLSNVTRVSFFYTPQIPEKRTPPRLPRQPQKGVHVFPIIQARCKQRGDC